MKYLAKAATLTLLLGTTLSAPAHAQESPRGPAQHLGYVGYHGPMRGPVHRHRGYYGPTVRGGYGYYGPGPWTWAPAPYPYPAYRVYEERYAPAPYRAPRAGQAQAASPKEFVIYFPFDGDRLTADAQRIVEQAVRYDRSQPGAQLTVVGYTDAAGAEGYNQNLSQRRSEAVRQALAAQGIAKAAIEIAWRGKHDQAVRTPDGVREEANRRVTIVVERGDERSAYQGRIAEPNQRPYADDRE